MTPPFINVQLFKWAKVYVLFEELMKVLALLKRALL